MTNFDCLPEAAAEKLERLIAERDARAEAVSLAADALRAREADLEAALRDLHALQMAAAGQPEITSFGLSTTTTYRKPDPDGEELAKGRIERAQLEVAHRRKLYSARQDAYRPLATLVARIEQFIATTLGGIVEAEPPALDLRRGESAVQAVERLRRRLSEIERERAAVERAPVDVATAKARARAAVEALARAGRPNIGPLLTPDGEGFSWPKANLRPQPVSRPAVNSFGDRFLADGGSASPPDIADTLAIMAWASTDALLTRLFTEIDAVASDAEGLRSA